MQIVQIVAMSSYKRRGQAFLVFDGVDSATKAIEKLQGFPFHGKQMVNDRLCFIACALIF